MNRGAHFAISTEQKNGPPAREARSLIFRKRLLCRSDDHYLADPFGEGGHVVDIFVAEITELLPCLFTHLVVRTIDDDDLVDVGDH